MGWPGRPWTRSWPDGGVALTTVAAAVRRYLDHLTVERGLAAHTIEAYRRDLQRYASTMAAIGTTQIGEVTTAQRRRHRMFQRDDTHSFQGAHSDGSFVCRAQESAGGHRSQNYVEAHTSRLSLREAKRRGNHHS